MADCTNCRAPLPDEGQFCLHCGARRAEAGSGPSAARTFLQILLVCFVGLPLAAGAGCASCVGVFAIGGGRMNDSSFAIGVCVAGVVTIATLVGFVRLIGRMRR